ncbi:MAG: SCP2 sterol-binding domain-containing protein [Promethearchaeota archaeon]
MVEISPFKTIIEKLAIRSDFYDVLEKILQEGKNIIENAEELKSEIKDYKEIYQMYLRDINIYFWIKLAKSTMNYGIGINKNATVKFIMTKSTLIRIFKRKISVTEAYMKGYIKIIGKISKLIMLRNLFQLFHKFVINVIKSKKESLTIICEV